MLGVVREGEAENERQRTLKRTDGLTRCTVGSQGRSIESFIIYIYCLPFLSNRAYLSKVGTLITSVAKVLSRRVGTAAETVPTRLPSVSPTPHSADIPSRCHTCNSAHGQREQASGPHLSPRCESAEECAAAGDPRSFFNRLNHSRHFTFHFSNPHK